MKMPVMKSMHPIDILFLRSLSGCLLILLISSLVVISGCGNAYSSEEAPDQSKKLTDTTEAGVVSTIPAPVVDSVSYDDAITYMLGLKNVFVICNY